MVSVGTASLGELTVRADTKITKRSGQKLYLAFACERGHSVDETGQARGYLILWPYSDVYGRIKPEFFGILP